MVTQLPPAVAPVRVLPAGGRARRVVAPAALAVAAVAAAGYVAAVDPNQPGHYPTCPFLALTGWYCPGCGTLRAVHALAHGHLGEALSRNALTVAALPVFVLLWVSWARAAWTGRPLRWNVPPWLAMGAIALVVAFGVLRNLPGFGVLAP